MFLGEEKEKVSDAQNHRKVEVGRDLWRASGPAPPVSLQLLWTTKNCNACQRCKLQQVLQEQFYQGLFRYFYFKDTEKEIRFRLS